MKLIVLLLLLGMQGCTNAELGQITSLGSPAVVTCYSGGKEIGKWKSTGKVSTEGHSDGWYFINAETERLIRVSGTCVVEN